MMDELLKKYGVKYEDLTSDEKETLFTWVDAIEKNQLTIDKIRDYVSNMKGVVENELATTGLNKGQDTLLKARLRNYLLLEAFLTSPEKARIALERAVSGIKKI